MLSARRRVGVNAATGRPLIGWAHVQQSLAKIWLTRVGQLLMRLDFGSNLRSHLAEDVTPALALQIYDDLVTATHTHEPEYRIATMQFVSLTRAEGAAGLGLRHGGVYYPEGRFGNYDLAEPVGLQTLPLVETLARRVA